MTNSYTSFVAQGAEDYLKSIDPDIWLQSMITESRDQPPFYPTWFENLLDAILRQSWGMTKDDITQRNCRSVYVKLINCINDE